MILVFERFSGTNYVQIHGQHCMFKYNIILCNVFKKKFSSEYTSSLYYIIMAHIFLCINMHNNILIW